MKVSSSTRAPNKRLNLLSKGSCRTFCCGCRLSVSSSEEADSVSSGRFVGISSLAHAMVQERLDQMIRERQEERRRERQGRRKQKSMARNGNKFVIMMMTMEKSSYDPRQDFQDSMVEMITANKIKEAKDLRCLLNYYMSMNSNEYRGLILEVFHDVCRSMFFGCECR